MHILVYIYLYTYICSYIYTHTLHTYILTYIYIYAHIYSCIHIYIYIHSCTQLYTHLYASIYPYIHKYPYIYIYTYMYTTHTPLHGCTMPCRPCHHLAFHIPTPNTHEITLHTHHTRLSTHCTQQHTHCTLYKHINIHVYPSKHNIGIIQSIDALHIALKTATMLCTNNNRHATLKPTITVDFHTLKLFQSLTHVLMLKQGLYRHHFTL